MSEISRRSVAKGAVWSIPAVTVAAAAPSLAASSTPAPAQSAQLLLAPWSNTFGSQKSVFGNDNQYFSMVMYPVDVPVAPSAGAAEAAAVTGARSAALTSASPVTAAANPNGKASFAPNFTDATTTNAVVGKTMTITITNLAGDATYSPTPRTWNNAGGAKGNAWPFLAMRDVGFYTIAGSAVGPNNGGTSAEYSGVPGTDANGRPTWTWTLTMQKNITSAADGASAVTVDAFTPPHVKPAGTSAPTYAITMTSPWGVVTFQR